jgi:hypothetical protein
MKMKPNQTKAEFQIKRTENILQKSHFWIFFSYESGNLGLGRQVFNLFE